jgi:hypothetical protein
MKPSSNKTEGELRAGDKPGVTEGVCRSGWKQPRTSVQLRHEQYRR